jgi:hypothetical protein
MAIPTTVNRIQAGPLERTPSVTLIFLMAFLPLIVVLNARGPAGGPTNFEGVA